MGRDADRGGIAHLDLPVFNRSNGLRPRFGTLTPNVCVADRPPGSAAVTVIVAVPRATPRTLTTLPATAGAAMPGSEDVAAKLSGSPSGSRKCSAGFTEPEAP